MTLSIQPIVPYFSTLLKKIWWLLQYAVSDGREDFNCDIDLEFDRIEPERQEPRLKWSMTDIVKIETEP